MNEGQPSADPKSIVREETLVWFTADSTVVGHEAVGYPINTYFQFYADGTSNAQEAVEGMLHARDHMLSQPAPEPVKEEEEQSWKPVLIVISVVCALMIAIGFSIGKASAASVSGEETCHPIPNGRVCVEVQK